MPSTPRKIVRHNDNPQVVPTVVPIPVVEETPPSPPLPAPSPFTPGDATIETPAPEPIPPSSSEDVIILTPATVITPNPTIDVAASISETPPAPPKIEVPDISPTELHNIGESLKPKEEPPKEPEVKTEVKPTELKPPKLHKKEDFYPPIPLKFWERA